MPETTTGDDPCGDKKFIRISRVTLEQHNILTEAREPCKAFQPNRNSTHQVQQHQNQLAQIKCHLWHCGHHCSWRHRAIALKKTRCGETTEAQCCQKITEKQVPGKKTRALNTRHFVTTDQVGRGNCAIECCPTDDMVGDHMTKGLQGVKFATFRKKIMGM